MLSVAQTEAEMDGSVKELQAQLDGNNWEYDYMALCRLLNVIKRLADRIQRKG